MENWEELAGFALTLAVGQDGDKYPYGARLAQGAGRFAARAARGQHVIDQENRLTAQGDTRTAAEGAMNVLAPAGRRLPSLLGSVPNPSEQPRPAGKPQAAGERVGQCGALIVTALPASPPMERHRHDYFSMACPQTRLGVLRPELPEEFGQGFSGCVFDA
jgi:hypothetical protein